MPPCKTDSIEYSNPKLPFGQLGQFRTEFLLRVNNVFDLGGEVVYLPTVDLLQDVLLACELVDSRPSVLSGSDVRLAQKVVVPGPDNNKRCVTITSCPIYARNACCSILPPGVSVAVDERSLGFLEAAIVGEVFSVGGRTPGGGLALDLKENDLAVKQTAETVCGGSRRTTHRRREVFVLAPVLIPVDVRLLSRFLPGARYSHLQSVWSHRRCGSTHRRRRRRCRRHGHLVPRQVPVLVARRRSRGERSRTGGAPAAIPRIWPTARRLWTICEEQSNNDASFQQEPWRYCSSKYLHAGAY